MGISNNGAWWLKPGQMIYATCSPQPEEGEDIIAAIVDAADGRFVLAPIAQQRLVYLLNHSLKPAVCGFCQATMKTWVASMDFLSHG